MTDQDIICRETAYSLFRFIADVKDIDSRA